MKFLRNGKPFSTLSLLTAALLMITILLAPVSGAAEKGNAAGTPKGQVLYTQFSLFYEGTRHYTTNYRKGILVPVNTEVKFVSASGIDLVVTLPSGTNLTLWNVRDFSGEDIDGIFSRTFSTRPLDLARFTDDEVKAIKAGQVVPGMSKPAVIAALGYPPKHKTPSLDLDQWRYWQNRFGTFVVHFENGQVKWVQD